MNKEVKIVLLFYSNGCPACNAFKPIFEDVSNEKESEYLVFKKLNVDEEDVSKLAHKYNISAIPTVIVFNNLGKEVDRISGSSRNEFNSFLIPYVGVSQNTWDKWF